jgi:predicted GNAT family N-acyltransferase
VHLKEKMDAPLQPGEIINMQPHRNVLVKKVSETTDIQICLAIRRQVFVEGQNVPINEEVDGLDPTSEHYLLYLNQLPAGTARVRYIDDYAKIERVAILDDYQGQGLGHVLMNFIIENIKQNPQVQKTKLSAQTYAIPFYEKLGFIVYSDEYLDAGISHKDMQLKLFID